MKPNSFDLTKNTIDVIVRIGFLAILVAWCIAILVPFLIPVLWGVLISIILHPLYWSMAQKLGGQTKLSSALLTIMMLLIIFVPSILFMDSLIAGAKRIGEQLASGQIDLPPPTDEVKNWPLIGEKTYDAWSLFTSNLEGALNKYEGQLEKLGKSILNAILGTTKGIVQFIFSVIIAGILLNYSDEGNTFANKFFKKLAGDHGEAITSLSNQTIRNVAKGILGVAFIQAFLAGMGFLLAGVPYAGLWALLVLMLAIMQLPPAVVLIPVIVFLFSNDSGFSSIAWTVYFIVVGLSDNFLKPILLGKGAPVPMLVIFLGSIGGFFSSGFIGLFVGAIVLSLGYQLMIAWVNELDSSDRKEVDQTN